jgi:hypothetical protein
VDVTSTTSRTQLTRETLEIIPTGRVGIQSVMVQAPGVRTNLDLGNPSGNPVFRVFGQDNESWTVIEGVATTSPNSNSDGSGNFFDYASMEESTVTTVGNSADSPTRGVQLSAIFKSGGNDFHGGGFWAQSGRRFQSDNLDDELRARGVTSGNPIDKRLDVSADLGGRIVRDKLWFYQSGRAREEDVQILGGFMPDGSPMISPMLEAYSTTKVPYQISPASKLIAFYQYYHRDWEGGPTQFVPWESRQLLQYRNHTSKLEWQFASGNKFLSLQAGQWIWHLARDGFSDDVTTADQLTNRVTGLNFDANTISFQGRKHLRGSLSWYKEDFFLRQPRLQGGVRLLLRQCRSQDIRSRYRRQLRADPAQRRAVPAECDEPLRVPRRSRDQSADLRSGQLEDDAPADTEPRRSLCARSGIPAGSVPGNRRRAT